MVFFFFFLPSHSPLQSQWPAWYFLASREVCGNMESQVQLLKVDPIEEICQRSWRERRKGGPLRLRDGRPLPQTTTKTMLGPSKCGREAAEPLPDLHRVRKVDCGALVGTVKSDSWCLTSPHSKPWSSVRHQVLYTAQRQWCDYG